MDIVKKNWISIACGVIALAALIAVFWPIGPYFVELQKEADDRARVNSTLNTLARKERELPLVELGATVPRKLEVWPTQAVIKEGMKVSATVKTEAAAMVAEANKINVHQILVPNSLPMPLTPVEGFDFIRQYKLTMDYKNADLGIRSGTITAKMLSAGVPPTEAEVKQEHDDRKAWIEQQMLRYDSAGKPTNAPEVTAMVAEKLEHLSDEMRTRVALRHKMYVSLDAPDIYPGIIDSTTLPPAETIFWAQVGIWIHSDLYAALAAANEKDADVLSAPVKHL